LFGHHMKDAGLPGTAVNAGVNGYGALEECWTVEDYADGLGTRVAVRNLFPNDVDANYQSVVLGGPVPEVRYAEMFGYLARMRTYCLGHGIALVVARIRDKGRHA